MHTIRVLFFATLRDRAGVKSQDMDIPDGMTVGLLKARIVQDFPDLDPAIETAVIAVNREFAFDEDAIPDHAEVALFPPVSGGCHS